MIMSKNLLLWEKWRPRSLEDMVLLPRIRKNFKSGLSTNFIFYGHYGTGKTSLARILIGKYTKDKPHLEINSSLHTSIDTLRGIIEDFCKTVPMMESVDSMKYIFLDEFERTSIQFQDGLKAFVEQYHKNVRFIITTNHLNKVSEGIKSRFSVINFDPESSEEEKVLKIEMFKKLKNICDSESINAPKETLINIINSKFPDLRNMIVDIQNFSDTGGSENLDHSMNKKLKMDLYNILYDKNQDYESVYHFLMSRFGQDKIDVMIKMLGKDFVDWSISEKKENIQNLFKFNYIISDYSSKMDSASDPIILGMTVVGKFRELINS